MADIDKLTSEFGKQQISAELLKNTYEKECEEFLRQKNIQFGGVKVQRSAQGQVDASSNCGIRTNLFKIQVKDEKRIMQHRVEIKGYRESRNGGQTPVMILFNDGDCAPFFKLERRATCSRIFDAFVERNQGVLPPRDHLYYDQQFDLFSTKKIVLNKELKFRTEDVFREDLENIVTRPAFRGVVEFQIKIDYVKTIPTSELLEVMANKFDDQSLEIVRFVNISTSQRLFTDTKQYTNLSNGLTYIEDFPPSFASLTSEKNLPGRVFISAGLKKSAKIVGPGTKFSRSFTVSPKLTLFYRPEGFLESFGNLIHNKNWTQIDKMIKGLYICPSHLLAREGDPRFVIAKVVGLGKPATKTFFKREEQDISVADYYTRVLGIRLADPNYPVVECKQRGSKIYYPLDVCEILDKQRVSTGALNADLTSALIREAATLPSLLQRRIKDCFNELKLVGSSFMQNAGMEVISEPVELNAPIMKAPLMNYSNGQNGIFDLESGMWRTSRLNYVSSGESVTWAIYGFVRGQNFSLDNLVKFASAYHCMCNDKGLRLSEPGECQVSNPIDLNDNDALEQAMRGCFERVVKPFNCRFIMVVTNFQDVPVHSYLKALEQEYGIITQNVTSKVALSTVDAQNPKRLSLENIVNKSNVKLGGVNYHVLNRNNSNLGQTELYIGFDFQQAGGGFGGENAGGGPPTVFSYAANDVKDPIAFTGDFIYHQSSVRGDLASIERAMVKICTRRKTINTPNRVIVYRHGASDGDFQYVSMYEMPLLRKIIDEHFGASVPLVLCIVTKNHSMFFTPSKFEVKQDRFGKQITGAKVENAQHGTLINQEVISSFYDEFYFSGSKGLQGTSKFSRYIVICNDAKMDLAELQKISYDLCFAFQIISSPVSFPAPVQIALMYAKRGRNLYNSDLNGKKVEAAGSYEELTNVLSFDRSSERSKRVNA